MKQVRPIKLLVADTAPLYPALWGGPKRIWGILKHLPVERFSITYVGMLEPDKPCKSGQVSENITQVLVPFPNHHPFFERWQQRIIPNLGFDLYRYFFMDLCRSFAKAIEKTPADVVIASHPWSAGLLFKKQNAINIYDAHNCEYLLMKNLVGSKRLGPAATMATWMAERQACRKSSLIFATSSKDAAALCRLYGLESCRVTIIPNGTDLPDLPDPAAKTAAKQRLGLGPQPVALFIGALYPPNIQAARLIAQNLAPNLPNISFVIAGSVCKALEGASTPVNLVLAGVLCEEDLQLHLAAADAGLNPVLQGSGVNIKMLDYMSAGLPVVSTPFGCRGLALEDNIHVIKSSPHNMANALASLMADVDACAILSKNARAFVEDGFGWEAISLKASKAIEGLLHGGNAGRGEP
ncbi:MAG: glycosyltransferase family 4 protein [Desulfatibacillaceae bacterium]|nr:glycosyltransferase family 4 protein [Desulfatibacillaceae bacterium]